MHHIKRRSEFGKKMKHLQDKIENLIALCRSCHNKAHDNVLTKAYLIKKHNKNLGK
ncbi:HNH endonuclease [Empedobacter sp.]|uniref:HNH endonuclease n=1 Tax=Empedobacter sp. TaxID=1927715 RepID=UPI002899D526|nr:HNH endonuclease [Empedobacter sp.]